MKFTPFLGILIGVIVTVFCIGLAIIGALRLKYNRSTKSLPRQGQKKQIRVTANSGKITSKVESQNEGEEYFGSRGCKDNRDSVSMDEGGFSSSSVPVSITPSPRQQQQLISSSDKSVTNGSEASTAIVVDVTNGGGHHHYEVQKTTPPYLPSTTHQQVR